MFSYKILRLNAEKRTEENSSKIINNDNNLLLPGQHN